jgi:hypothetical protein
MGPHRWGCGRTAGPVLPGTEPLLLSTLTSCQVKELEAKSRVLSELTTTLQREERARAAAQQEATALRAHLQTLERELRNAQVTGGYTHQPCQ